MKSNKRLFIEKWIDPSAYGDIFPAMEQCSESWDKIENELNIAVEKDDGWIKIEVGCNLPKINKTVLLFTNIGRSILSYVAKNGVFDDQDINRDEYFTHWRELPKPPLK